MKILIADDAGFIREMLSRVYEEAGHEIVAEATTGPEAISLTQNTNPDVIIMDLVLPLINGLEATIEILKNNPTKKIIACSSLEESWVEDQARESGCCYFLKKPFSKNEALKALDFAFTDERLANHG